MLTWWDSQFSWDLPTAREGNVFTRVCHSVHNRPHGYSATAHPCWLLDHCSSLLAIQSLFIRVGYSVTAHHCYGAVGMYPNGMLSCCGFWILAVVRTNHLTLLLVCKCSLTNFVLWNVESSTKDTYALNTNGREKIMLISIILPCYQVQNKVCDTLLWYIGEFEIFCILNPKSVA